MHLARRRPDIGESVGEYKIVELLGMGGLGVVFKVERSGSFFAMKFLTVPRLDGRAKREISILNHLDNSCCVRYVGSDYWPNPKAGLPFIVMEYVPGDTLETFAMRHNPAARKVTRIVRDIARTLGEVHEKGVFHRDLKPSNVIIRGAAERPVLIDFGVASLAGAAGLTAASIPPGTDEYRAPEPLRFAQENEGNGKRYEFACSDELWALGVLFYWLLTDVLPFGERRSDGDVAKLYERILHDRPPAPHLVNPRAPLAASRLCMKMLAEWPADRFPNVPELCEALQAALTKANDDPAWDVPLVDPNGPQLTTTDEDPALREPDEAFRAFRAAGKWRPRRGQVPPNGEPDMPPLPAQVARSHSRGVGEEQDSILTVDAQGPGASPPCGELLGMAAPEAPAREQLGPVRPRHPKRPRWLLGLVAAILAGVLAAPASLGLWGSASGVRENTGEVDPQNPPPKSASSLNTDQGVRGREVALSWVPAQPPSQVGAAPVWAQPPTLDVNAMSTQTTKNETPKTQKPRAGLRLPVKTAAVTAAVLASCTGAGCTARSTYERPEPPPISCPDGWEETHKKFKLGRGTVAVGGSKGIFGEETRIREGATSARVDSTELGLPKGSVIFGAWRFERDRVYATFTQAEIPGQGTAPVCLVVGLDSQASMGFVDGVDAVCPAGLGTCLNPGSSRGNVMSFQRIHVYRANWPF